MSSAKVRPVFDKQSSTWTYIIYDQDSMKAIILDPVLEQRDRDISLLSEMGVVLEFVIETHIHADHITSASELRRLTGAKIAYGATNNEVDGADLFLDEQHILSIGSFDITTIFTPGHTKGCTSFTIEGCVFTGDALFVRGCGRTDFQEGSSHQLFQSVRNKLFSLEDKTIVYPAHDYSGFSFSTIGEEKQYNPRLNVNKKEEEFIEIMENLNLPDPAMMDEAVPANLKCGFLGDS